MKSMVSIDVFYVSAAIDRNEILDKRMIESQN
jgi:hypothetical protein